ncbi:MAG: ABC transporter ATP-binding protein [Candidatus Bathyarchaeia archaeon]|nr:ABC transporter ATP-binding protein [Candidatus Bathyarchaeota archaeon]
MSKTILSISDLNVYYGSLEAVHDVSFNVKEGEIFAIIGSNGAGKTSILNAIVGLVRYTGNVQFLGEKIDNLKTYQRVARGLSLVPESSASIFTRFTVLENLMIGSYVRRSEKNDMLERVFNLFPRLKERSNQMADKLSGGERKMLLIGRALMSNPKLLLLDEVSLGLSPLITEKIYAACEEINEQGITILLVEQSVWKALEKADSACLIESGKIIKIGTAEELKDEEYIRRAYLGL